jgi:hypothetical protein
MAMRCHALQEFGEALQGRVQAFGGRVGAAAVSVSHRDPLNVIV